MEKTVKAETKVNYRSDFDLYLTLTDCRGTDLGWPEWDWTAKFYTSTKFTTYTASCIGGVCTNCFNDNGKIHVVFDNHRLPEGPLNVEFAALLPEGIFPDGDRKVSVPAALAVMLTRDAAPCPSSVEVDMLLPFVKGKWEDLTPEEIAELQRPATEAAEELRQDMTALEKTLDENEKVRIENEEVRQREENTRHKSESVRTAHESERQTAERNRQTAETERGMQEDIRVSNENARVEAENKRAETFSGWETELDSKAAREELSNIVGVPAEEEIEDLEPGIMATLLRTVPQVLTPEEQAQVKANLAISKMELFCDLFNAEAGDAGYARITNGVFDCELNRLKLTYEEAVKIYGAGTITSSGSAAFFNFFPCKTNLPPKGHGGKTSLSGIRPTYELDRLFVLNDVSQPNILEVLNLELPSGMTIADTVDPIISITGSVSARSKLRKILGNLHITLIKSRPKFIVAPNLEEVRLWGLFHDCDLSGMPKLSLNSLRCLVEHKYVSHPSSPIVTVHPDVYTKLTDAGNAEWHKVLTDAANKNITFATV